MPGKKESAASPPRFPNRPERRDDWRWPSPTPILPAEDTGRVLKEILYRLDAIEKRLEKIEHILARG